MLHSFKQHEGRDRGYHRSEVGAEHPYDGVLGLFGAGGALPQDIFRLRGKPA